MISLFIQIVVCRRRRRCKRWTIDRCNFCNDRLDVGSISTRRSNDDCRWPSRCLSEGQKALIKRLYVLDSFFARLRLCVYFRPLCLYLSLSRASSGSIRHCCFLLLACYMSPAVVVSMVVGAPLCLHLRAAGRHEAPPLRDRRLLFIYKVAGNRNMINQMDRSVGERHLIGSSASLRHTHRSTASFDRPVRFYYSIDGTIAPRIGPTLDQRSAVNLMMFGPAARLLMKWVKSYQRRTAPKTFKVRPASSSSSRAAIKIERPRANAEPEEEEAAAANGMMSTLVRSR